MILENKVVQKLKLEKKCFFKKWSPKLIYLKFIYFEKATKFCEISTVNLSYVVPVKSTVEISQNIVAFSKYMNFKYVVSSLIID